MSRALYWWLLVATGLLAMTGLTYAGMKYLMVGDDPFSAYNHPAQPWMLAAHVLLAPALVLALGWAWGAHAAPKLAGEGLRDRRGRRVGARSGLSNLAAGAAMVASGYGLQVTASETLRTALAWSHGISGGLFLILLAVHAALALRRARRAAASRPAGPRESPDQGQVAGSRSSPEDSVPQEPSPQAFWARTR